MNRARACLLVSMLIAPALLASCADGPEPVAPETAVAYSNGRTSSVDLEVLASYSAGSPGLTIGLAWRSIGPAGGSLRLGDFELIVPAGAVDRATRFSIRLDVAGQHKNKVLAEFSPHNQTFAQDLTLRVPYAGTSADGAEANVLRWNGDQWVEFSTTPTEDGRLETTTDHLSSWGTEDPERGYIVLGG